MGLGGVGLAGVLQQVGQALVRVGMVWRRDQSRLVVQPRLVRLAIGQQGVGQVDASDGLVRVMADRLGVGGAGGGAEAGRIEQGAQIVQRAEMTGVERQDGEVGLARLVDLARLGQQAGAQVAKIDVIRLAGEEGVDLRELGHGRNFLHSAGLGTAAGPIEQFGDVHDGPVRLAGDLGHAADVAGGDDVGLQHGEGGCLSVK